MKRLTLYALIAFIFTGCAQKIGIQQTIVPFKDPAIRYLTIEPFANDRYGFEEKFRSDLLNTFIDGKPFFHLGEYPTRLYGSIHTKMLETKEETKTKDLCLVYETREKKSQCRLKEKIPYICKTIRFEADVHIRILRDHQIIADKTFKDYKEKKLCNEPRVLLDSQKVIQKLSQKPQTILIKRYKTIYHTPHIDPSQIFASLLKSIEKRVYFFLAPHRVRLTLEFPTTIDGKENDKMKTVANLASKHKYQKALWILQELEKRFPQSYEIYYAKALLLEAMGKKRRALQNYEKAFWLHPDSTIKSRIDSIEDELWLHKIISLDEPSGHE